MDIRVSIGTRQLQSLSGNLTPDFPEYPWARAETSGEEDKLRGGQGTVSLKDRTEFLQYSQGLCPIQCV